MVKLDPTFFRFMTKEEFRVLKAIENGMRNHELVPLVLISRLSKYSEGLVKRTIVDLHRHKLVWHTKVPYEGYRLTYLGYDYLALKSLTDSNKIVGIGRKIGVGKEADIYIASNAKGDEVVLKFHRLGRTSFKAVKNKRDYSKKTVPNWLMMSIMPEEQP